MREKLDKLAHKIKKKRAEIDTALEQIASLRDTVKQEERYLQALEDAYRMMDKDSPEGGSEVRSIVVLKPGSDLAKVRDILLDAGHPLHIKVIMERMGLGTDQKAQSSLVGSLGQYVRKKKVFDRPEPNVFGLIELSNVAELNRAAGMKTASIFVGKH